MRAGYGKVNHRISSNNPTPSNNRTCRTIRRNTVVTARNQTKVNSLKAQKRERNTSDRGFLCAKAMSGLCIFLFYGIKFLFVLWIYENINLFVICRSNIGMENLGREGLPTIISIFVCEASKKGAGRVMNKMWTDLNLFVLKQTMIGRRSWRLNEEF